MLRPGEPFPMEPDAYGALESLRDAYAGVLPDEVAFGFPSRLPRRREAFRLPPRQRHHRPRWGSSLTSAALPSFRRLLQEDGDEVASGPASGPRRREILEACAA
jgi:hypothetical protein